MQVEYKLKIGSDEFTLKAEVKDEKEFFEEMSFYSNLPRTAPGGATDLKLVFRTTTEGHKYYSIISEKEKLEYKFGQNKEKKGNGLYPKGWETLFGADQQPASQGANPLAGLGAPQQQVPQQATPQLQTPALMPAYQPPVQQAAPSPAFQNPFPSPQAPTPQMPNPAFPGMVNPSIGPTSTALPAAAAQPKAPAPVGPGLVFPQATQAAPVPQAGPAQLSPELAAAKTNVLERFNIKKS